MTGKIRYDSDKVTSKYLLATESVFLGSMGFKDGLRIPKKGEECSDEQIIKK